MTKERPAEDWNGVTTVEVTGLRKSYGFTSSVVDGLDLSVPTGSVYALLGRNGSGKTTVLRTILGIYKRDGGDVRIFGRDPQRQGAAVMARTGYVGESFLGYDSTSVSAYLAFLARCYRNWDRAWCSTLLARFDLPLEKKVSALSRGAQTKLALIGALSHKPDLLVLDDPTLGLDAVVLDEFFETIAEVTKRFGTTVLLASHNLMEMESVVSHVGFLADGKLLMSDTLDALRVRTREVRITFRDDPPDLSKIAHFKQLRVSGRHVSGMVFDTASNAMDRLRSLNPEEIEVRELSLREIYVNFLR
jgi:ABC-2 type transport system ATP-binding protein